MKIKVQVTAPGGLKFITTVSVEIPPPYAIDPKGNIQWDAENAVLYRIRVKPVKGEVTRVLKYMKKTR